MLVLLLELEQLLLHQILLQQLYLLHLFLVQVVIFVEAVLDEGLRVRDGLEDGLALRALFLVILLLDQHLGEFRVVDVAVRHELLLDHLLAHLALRRVSLQLRALLLLRGLLLLLLLLVRVGVLVQLLLEVQLLEQLRLLVLLMLPLMLLLLP